MRLTVLASVAVVAAALVAPTRVAAADTADTACTWTPSALSLPAGSGSAQAETSNHQGGYSGLAMLADGLNHVVSWRNGQFIDYGGKLDGAYLTEVNDENRAGTVVGTALRHFGGAFPIGPTIAFRTVGGTLQQLPQPANPDRVRAFAINDRGDITGENYIRTGDNSGHYVLRWPADRPGEVVQLPIPTNHIPRGADEDGSVLLWSPDGYKIWRNGTMIRLTTLPGSYSTTASQLTAGRVVGAVSFQVTSSTYRVVAVLWDTNGTIHELPNSRDAETINRNGLIAGRADSARGGGTGIWRLTQFEHAFPGAESVVVNSVADDGVLVGSRYSMQAAKYSPFTWRCP